MAGSAEALEVTDPIARTVFGAFFETGTDAALVIEQATRRIVAANSHAVDLFALDRDTLLGMRLDELAIDPDRDLLAPGTYEEVALRRADYPVHVQVKIAIVETVEHGTLVALMARDTSARRLLERELLAKHTALLAAHADLERAHAQLTETKAELERRNQEIAMLAWRAAMGELVAGIAHHLNNPVGALGSTVRRLAAFVARLPHDIRGEPERLMSRINQIATRIESNVTAIVSASRANAIDDLEGRPELPPELTAALARFAERLDDIPTKERS